MFNLEMVKKNNIPYEYSQRSDGKWNLWCQMQATWFAHDLNIEVHESGMDHLDYKQWVGIDVLDELPQAHALRNIKNKARGKK